MKIVQKKSDDFIASATIKDTIVLHYTGGGSLAGAEATLGLKDYVNVHYCIDKDGTVYQYIDEKYWAYHTGTGKANDRHYIGIEIVNWGHLARKGNKLCSWVNSVIDWDKTVRCTKFRGFEYWEKLTPQQEAVLPELIAEIKARNPIKKVITHAKVKPTKLDFPPDYPQLKNIID